MKIGWLILLVLAAGAVGGLVNCLMMGEPKSPKYDPETKAWRPGWLGNVLIGAVAALAVWGIYGPLASFDFASSAEQRTTLTVSQLITSIVIGLSGGKILTTMAQRKSDEIAKDELSNTVDELIEGEEKDENKPRQGD